MYQEKLATAHPVLFKLHSQTYQTGTDYQHPGRISWTRSRLLFPQLMFSLRSFTSITSLWLITSGSVKTWDSMIVINCQNLRYLSLTNLIIHSYRYLRLYYCSQIQQLSIEIKPRELHNAPIRTIEDAVNALKYKVKAEKLIRLDKTKPISHIIKDEETLRSRVPDLIIALQKASGYYRDIIAVESAFAQAEAGLDEAAVDYLQHTQGRIKMVIKCCLKEKVDYHSPFQNVLHEDKEVKYITLLGDYQSIPERFSVDELNPLDGVTYKGYKLIHPFDAWIEVWVLQNNGEPKKQGRRMVCYPRCPPNYSNIFRKSLEIKKPPSCASILDLIF